MTHIFQGVQLIPKSELSMASKLHAAVDVEKTCARAEAAIPCRIYWSHSGPIAFHIFAAVLVVVVMVAFKILSRIELAVSKPRFDLMKY